MASTDQASAAALTTRLPQGFRFAGVACGIKPSGKSDLSLIVCDQPSVAAGVYTQNQVVAPPVLLCRSRTPSTSIRAVVTNSGNANVCTGETGRRDAERMCQQVASLVGTEEQDVLVMSTGVIGRHLPMDCVQRGISHAHDTLETGPQAFDRCADAILTTDKSRKTRIRPFTDQGQDYSIAAMAKGAGMIAPNMATMLAVILTDAPLTPSIAQQVLTEAADASFNRVSVDGHTSTNDTLLLLSSGGGEPLASDSLTEFQKHVNEISIQLAKELVADGEGASHIMAIRVLGAADDAAAAGIAETVAASPLVKTAVTGNDPNWGRIVSAAGYAPAEIRVDQMCLRICGHLLFEHGSPIVYDESAVSHEMKSSLEVEIELTVGDGPGKADYWSSDLTTDYVSFNSEYTT